MSPKPAKVRKDVRMSLELAAWIESLPPRYGESFSEKARAMLEIAREYEEKERRAIEGTMDENKQESI